MVKNVAGGNKSKGFARKNIVVKRDTALRVSQEEAEVYAQVVKLLGGAMCHVVTLDGTKMLCHIRGKFRGRGKRDNFIGNGTWMLVGLRDWEKEPLAGKLLNCDVIEVYTDADKNKLKTIHTVDWSLFISNDCKTLGASESGEGSSSAVDFEFIDEKTQEFYDLIQTQIDASKEGKTTTIVMDDGDMIDIDDI